MIGVGLYCCSSEESPFSSSKVKLLCSRRRLRGFGTGVMNRDFAPAFDRIEIERLTVRIQGVMSAGRLVRRIQNRNVRRSSLA